ncbi:MAG: TPR end-of-group domain-containing protein [Opitutales bacterium]
MAKAEEYAFEVGFFESLHRRMPKDARVISILAHLYTEIGRIDSGLKMDRKLVRLTPEDPLAHYNLACSLSLKRRYPDAVRSLRTAISLGYKDIQWMCDDPDLRHLQEYPGFIRLLRELGHE